VHILLFVLTVGTTTLVGIEYYASYAGAFGTVPVVIDRSFLVDGLIYSAALLGILGAHEMGHYLACRYYDVDATLPYFLPFPGWPITGTLGAVIRIREPFPTRKALFDIGVAGPIAGFVVLVPLLLYAMSRSTLVHAPMPEVGLSFAEPLLFKLVEWLKFGRIDDGVQLNLHPIGFAAWFGMLATAWNLLPFGQLDGGHLTYATLGDRSRYFSMATVAAAIVMCFISTNWILMTVLMLVMLYFFGPRHPRPLDEEEPLGGSRYAVAVFALVMFVLCFMPIPITALGQ